MSDLLIELFQEEIPARMQVAAEENLARLVTDRLKANGIAFEACETYSTPRRLTLNITGIPASRADVSEELKGPAVTAPEQALAGFLKKAGLDSADQLTKRDIKGTDYYFYESVKKGGPTIDVLGDLITDAIANMPWPKSMRWGSNTVRWVRPLHTILAIFDGAVVKGSFDLGNSKIDFCNETKGHRFMSDGQSFAVSSFADYKAKLAERGVILSRAERKQKIWNAVLETAAKDGFTVFEDERLLEEVVGLVEWPVPFMGGFEEHFLEIPAEVISTSMRENQRYFSVKGKDGKLTNRFITLANVTPDDDGKTIIYGNEKVLRARLSDARFFWDQDLKSKLEAYLPRLEQIRFHEKLGSVAEKSERISKLAAFIATAIGADANKAARAGQLCKADLVTGMVREFPEIQGIMGGYYAAKSGEDKDVASAISSHYSPAGPSDSCPTEPVAIAVALADKLDTLVGFFSIGEKPTGSKDPFALRRSALGIMRIILENKLPLNVLDLIDEAANLYNAKRPADIEGFILDRFKVSMKGDGFDHNIIEAVAGDELQGNLFEMKLKLEQISSILSTDQGQDFVSAAKRAISILESEEKKDKKTYDGSVSENTLQEAEEKNLYSALEKVMPEVEKQISEKNFGSAMSSLASVKETVDLFFDKVVVNDNNPEIRANRLALLSRIRSCVNKIADFSRL